jgi:hypothetical protein
MQDLEIMQQQLIESHRVSIQILVRFIAGSV